MQWQESSIVLSARLFAENLRIVTVFNETFGKTSGLVRGIKTPIQFGDLSHVLWRGRTPEQLGTFQIENVFSPFCHAFADSRRILILESACALCSKGLPEKAPHPKLFSVLKSLFLSITGEDWLVNYVFFEISFLAEVGMGLDLSKCAVTGQTDNLFYISPCTGRAVIRSVGENYKDRLFRLPSFLVSNDNSPSNMDIFSALEMTGHFLRMYFCGISCRELPLSRDYLLTELGEKIHGVTA
ncbi:MAG: DNA repair protein RecO [Holosporaceae bacterium]|nr:DNA repair protein RecO [Holosporaceae bacterium]